MLLQISYFVTFVQVAQSTPLQVQAELADLTPHDVTVKVKACAMAVTSQKILTEVLKSWPRLHYSVGQDVAGIVTEVGSQVKTFKPGDRIAGILPLDAECSGCANYSVISEYNAIRIPDHVSYTKAAASIGAGLKAYTALHYQARLSPGETVLITDAAAPWCVLTAQLATLWGAKVLSISSSLSSNETVQSPANQMTDVSSKNIILYNSVMEETGGIGADIIIDNGLNIFKRDSDMHEAGENRTSLLPSKHQIISCLAVGGRWVSSHPHIQLDPPDSHQLFLRAASLSFLFHHVWTLSNTHHGRFLHVVADIVDKVSKGNLQPSITQTVTTLKAALACLQKGSLSRHECVILELS